MKRKIKCPFCKKELSRGEDRRYETLMDHVMDPNAENYPLRETFVCACERSKYVFWDNYGSFYLTTSMTNTDFKWNENYDAINSLSYRFNKKWEREKELNRYFLAAFG